MSAGRVLQRAARCCRRLHQRVAWSRWTRALSLSPTERVSLFEELAELQQQKKNGEEEELTSLGTSTPRTARISIGSDTAEVQCSPFSSPFALAKAAGLLGVNKALLALVDGLPHDVHVPIRCNDDCSVLNVQLLSAQDWDASSDLRQVFWHSSAHILGAALENVFGNDVKLCDGPALTRSGQGFFYEGMFTDANGQHFTLHPDDLAHVEAAAKAMIKDNSRFQRVEAEPAAALELFRGNPFKETFIRRAQGAGCQVVSLYRCGSLVDLCLGPHLPATGVVKGFTLTKLGASEWVGHQGVVTPLQRVYGVSFPTKHALEAWQAAQAEAAKRDHRVIGRQQELFMMNETSPGAPFFLPHGVRILNKMKDILRQEYSARGYDEVQTPLVFSDKLWKQSGHWDHYAEDMYIVSGLEHRPSAHAPDTAEEHRGLKPMNCPAHCLLFKAKPRHECELPMRIADFSPLHRNEASGALSGLTRVRQFHQDDAHIFCTKPQMAAEINGCLDLVERMYSMFGFNYKLTLSTRPESFVGDPHTWDEAEGYLRQCLEQLNRPWTVNEGDGAFYGPKIDITLTDALQREHQTATIQLDFQLPQRFDLKYQDANGSIHAPVIIHRAILGSLERFLAVLIEHTAGKWPFFISPRQALLCPIGLKHVEFCNSIARKLRQGGVYADVDDTGDTINRKIKRGQELQYNYILVVGDEDVAAGAATVRHRDMVRLRKMLNDQQLNDVFQLSGPMLGGGVLSAVLNEVSRLPEGQHDVQHIVDTMRQLAWP